MKKFLLLLTAGCLSASQCLWAQKKWTLEECISYANEHNLSLQGARLSSQSAIEDVKGSKAALLPTLSASTNQNVGFTPWTTSGTITVSNGRVDTEIKKWSYNGSYGLNASWTVWNGNRNYNKVKQSKLTAEQAELQTEVTAKNIQEQISQLYIQILYLNEAVKVTEQSLETSKKNEERGLSMLEVGKMSKADVAQLTAQRATDEYNIVEAKSNIARYKLQLKQLLRINHESDFDIAIPATSDEQALNAIPPLQLTYEQALATRPEIAYSELGIKNSAVATKIAKAGYLPTVNMSTSAGTSTSSRSSDTWGSQMKTNFDVMGGVSISIPIFDGRSTKTAVRKAKIQQQQAELDLLTKQDDLYKTIEGFWLDAETNQQKFRAATASVQSEQQSYDLLQEQFNLGLKNIVELMTGKDKLLTAQQNKLQSKYQTLLAQQMLKFYSGN